MEKVRYPFMPDGWVEALSVFGWQAEVDGERGRVELVDLKDENRRMIAYRGRAEGMVYKIRTEGEIFGEELVWFVEQIADRWGVLNRRNSKSTKILRGGRENILGLFENGGVVSEYCMDLKSREFEEGQKMIEPVWVKIDRSDLWRSIGRVGYLVAPDAGKRMARTEDDKFFVLVEDDREKVYTISLEALLKRLANNLRSELRDYEPYVEPIEFVRAVLREVADDQGVGKIENDCEEVESESLKLKREMRARVKQIKIIVRR